MEGKSSMSNQQILEQAIQKAIDGGWKLENIKHTYIVDDTGMFVTSFVDREIYEEYQINTLIFNHDFAKAFWGEEPYLSQETLREIADVNGEPVPPVQAIMQNWEYHLREMVIADDPIRYLGENI